MTTLAGGTLLYTQSDADFAASSASGNHFRLFVHTTNSLLGFGDFQTMYNLARFEPGYYPDVRRYPFHNPARGGLDWNLESRGCNRVTGWFAVDSVTYDGNALTSIDLRFEQHCEGSAPALRGRIRWLR